jgi:hypothetical protein
MDGSTPWKFVVRKRWKKKKLPGLNLSLLGTTIIHPNFVAQTE